MDDFDPTEPARRLSLAKLVAWSLALDRHLPHSRWAKDSPAAEAHRNFRRALNEACKQFNPPLTFNRTRNYR